MIKAKVKVMKVVNRKPWTPQMGDLFFNEGDEMAGYVDTGHTFRIYFSNPVDDKYNYVDFGAIDDVGEKDVLHTKGGIFKLEWL